MRSLTAISFSTPDHRQQLCKHISKRPSNRRRIKSCNHITWKPSATRGLYTGCSGDIYGMRCPQNIKCSERNSRISIISRTSSRGTPNMSITFAVFPMQRISSDINARLGKIFMEVHNGIRRESSQPNRLRSRRPNDISNNQSALIAFASVASFSPFSSSNPFRFLSFLSDLSMISFRSVSTFRSHATQFR